MLMFNVLKMFILSEICILIVLTSDIPVFKYICFK